MVVLYPLRNNQTDPADSPRTPVPAPIVLFSWTGISALPYTYSTDDPTTLLTRLTVVNGAGAGKLTWANINWLKTSY